MYYGLNFWLQPVYSEEEVHYDLRIGKKETILPEFKLSYTKKEISDGNASANTI